MTLRKPGRSVRCRRTVRVLAVGSLSVIAAALGGCAAGQRAQTANEYSVVDGTSTDVGSMGLRDAGLSAPASAAGYAKGASATLSMTVVNNGRSPDKLVSVSTPKAARATITAPTPAAGIPVTGAAATSIAVPAYGAVTVGSDSGAAKITLGGLKDRLVPGQLIPVTMKFQLAGQVILQLPVKLVAGQTGGPTVQVSPPAPSGI